jgi:capsular polysaccharide export protein
MKYQPLPHRRFLFLQGPPGPFFWLLGQRLEELACSVQRINLNGGDQADWPGKAVNYRGSRKRWTLFIDRFLRDNGITDILLFGDCRPLHMAAHHMARLRHINVHVFEEGYIRPDWVTLEPSGVNGHSALPRDPDWFLERAAALPPVPERPAITASFRRRVRDAYRYYHHVVVKSPLFPFYQSHRQGSLIGEGLGWARKLATRKTTRLQAERALQHIGDQPYFLFPLQLTNDYQIREHSPFASMAEAVDYVLHSFARRAPSDVDLVVKVHPLDAGFMSWRRYLAKRAKALGIAGRVFHIDGGDLLDLTTQARGMVTVNSTSATLALQAGVPTMALGKAVYAMEGITHQGRLDDFWMRPEAPDPEVYEAFRRVLYDQCLIYGGLASQTAISTLVESAVERLVGDWVSHWQPAAPIFAAAAE